MTLSIPAFDTAALEQWSDPCYDVVRDADGNVTIPASRYDQLRADCLASGEHITLILTRLETLERAVLLCQSELDWCIGYASARESDWGVRLTQALRGARALLTSERPAEREEQT